jgi:hypothetical protein
MRWLHPAVPRLRPEDDLNMLNTRFAAVLMGGCYWTSLADHWFRIEGATLSPEIRKGPQAHHVQHERRKWQRRRWAKPFGMAQLSLLSHAMIYGHFQPRRHLMSADQYRRTCTRAFQIWRQGTSVQIEG